jgi:hypothetical protein
MSLRTLLRFTPIATIVAGISVAALTAAPAARAPLAIDSAKVTIAGNSNVHAWTAASTTVRLTRVALGSAVTGPGFWDEVVKPGAIEAFEIAVPTTSLKSDKDGMDKNMYKALKATEHPEIAFRLARLEPAASGAFKAVGFLRIAGVEKEVALDLKVTRREAALVVKGELALLMTDYGVKPPTAMLGMLKTDPKVTITFETILAVPLT